MFASAGRAAGRCGAWGGSVAGGRAIVECPRRRSLGRLFFFSFPASSYLMSVNILVVRRRSHVPLVIIAEQDLANLTA